MKSMTVILLAVAFVVIICAGFTVAHAITGDNGNMQSFNQTDSNKIITVRPGETIKVLLDENPTTGYSWVFNVTSGLTIAKDTYHDPPAASSAPAASTSGRSRRQALAASRSAPSTSAPGSRLSETRPSSSSTSGLSEHISCAIAHRRGVAAPLPTFLKSTRATVRTKKIS